MTTRRSLLLSLAAAAVVPVVPAVASGVPAPEPVDEPSVFCVGPELFGHDFETLTQLCRKCGIARCEFETWRTNFFASPANGWVKARGDGARAV